MPDPHVPGFFQPRPEGPVPFGRIFPVDEEWLARTPPEEVIDPRREIVDAHHHLWDMPGNRYLIDEVTADFGSGHTIVSSVYVDCGVMYRASGPDEFKYVGETEFANGVAAMSASGDYGPTRVAEAIVGHARIDSGRRVGDVLDAHVAAGGGRFRGIRQSGATHPDPEIGAPTAPVPHMLTLPSFHEGARELVRRDLSFEAWVFFTQLDDVVALAKAVPELPIAVGHAGGPLAYGPYAGHAGEVLAEWSARLRELAALPNVVIKLGGGTMRLGLFRYLGDEPPLSSERIAELWGPWYRRAIEIFGAERCMFESNFPVDKMGMSYRTVWNAFKRIAADGSEAEKDALFSVAARRHYRLT